MSSHTAILTLLHTLSIINHSVVVQAVNNIGGTERTSDPVEITVVTLPVGPPQVPAKPTVTPFNNTCARISWMDPGQWGINEKEVKRLTKILGHI